jgi:hypothetical protein
MKTYIVTQVIAERNSYEVKANSSNDAIGKVQDFLAFGVGDVEHVPPQSYDQEIIDWTVEAIK